MDYGKALTFIFEDPRWPAKIAVGAGLLIAGALIGLAIFVVGIIAVIPIAELAENRATAPGLGIGFVFFILCLMLLAGLIYLAGYLIVRGYSIRLLQNVRDGLSSPLPEWNQWSRDLVRGLKSVIVNVVWSLPFAIVFIPFFCIFPLAMLNVVSGAPDESAFVGMQAAIWCMIPATLLVQILYQLVAPGFTIAFADAESIGASLRFPTIIRWTWRNARQVVVVALVAFGVTYAISTVAATAGMILCFVGLLVAVPVGTLIASLYTYHLYGQLAVACPLDSLPVPHSAFSEPALPPSSAPEPPAGEDDSLAEPPSPPSQDDQPPAA